MSHLLWEGVTEDGKQQYRRINLVYASAAYHESSFLTYISHG